MNANKFTSRYLPFDLFCAECEKLGITAIKDIIGVVD